MGPLETTPGYGFCAASGSILTGSTENNFEPETANLCLLVYKGFLLNPVVS